MIKLRKNMAKKKEKGQRNHMHKYGDLPLVILSITLLMFAVLLNVNSNLTGYSTYNQTIFSENFESGLEKWEMSGNGDAWDSKNLNSYEGKSLRAKPKGGLSIAETTITNIESENIKLSFYAMTENLDYGEYFKAEYYDGSKWHLLIREQTIDNYSLYEYELDNISDEILLRFECFALDNKDKCYIDSVNIVTNNSEKINETQIVEESNENIPIKEINIKGAVKDSKKNKLTTTFEISSNDIKYEKTNKDHDIKINSGKYKVKITPENHKIKEIVYDDIYLDSDITEIVEIDEVENKYTEYKKVYAINPIYTNFTNATVTSIAEGTSLYKCKEWDFEAQECLGTWNLFKTGLVPGEEYSFILTPDDPGFAEDENSWWNNEWEYRRDINITETSGSALSDYEVELMIDTATLISTNKMNNDCSDLRFISNDTSLPYWIEDGCNTANTSVWVNIGNLDASDYTIVYMYYGNDGASSVSNGVTTFDFFDDFDNTNNWFTAARVSSCTVNTFSASSSMLTLEYDGSACDRFAWTYENFTLPLIVEYRDLTHPNWGGLGSSGWYRSVVEGLDNLYYTSYGGGSLGDGDDYGYLGFNENGRKLFVSNDGSTSGSSDISINPATTFNSTMRFGSSDAKWYVDDVLKDTISSITATSDPMKLLFRGYSWNAAYPSAKTTLDTVFVRSYSSSEPSYIVGDEDIKWWNNNWGYRKAVNITETSGSALSDYEVELMIDTATLISANKMNNDCSDLRFISNDTSLPYWIEDGCNTANTSVWVNIGNLDASDYTIVYMYYGNDGASSVSNGVTTFDFFDDFDNTNNWFRVARVSSCTINTFSTTSSMLTLEYKGSNCDVYAWTYENFTLPLIVEYRDLTHPNWGGTGSSGWYRSVAEGFDNYYYVMYGGGSMGDGNDYGFNGFSEHGRSFSVYNDGVSSSNSDISMDPTTTFNSTHKFGSSDAKWYVNDVLKDTRSSITATSDPMKLLLKGASWSTSYPSAKTTLDTVFVRSYSSSEPSYTTSNEEERPNDAPTVDSISLNATSSDNTSNDNLTLHYTTSDSDGDSIKNITNWFKDGSSITVLNMPFEGGSNSSYTKDYSIYNNGGSVTNAIWNKNGGYDGFGAYHFDGSGDYITLSDSDSLDLTSAGTISAWIKIDSLSGNGAIVTRSSTNGYLFGVYSTGKITWGKIGVDEVQSSTNLTTNTWYHVAVTHGSGTNTIYINGAYDNSGSGANFAVLSNAVLIGDYSSHTWPFDGTIDDVQMYNVALSEEQITAIYNNRTDIIVSQETDIDDEWYACLTPNDGAEDGAQSCSNNITIVNDIPQVDSISLNATSASNTSNDNLTLHYTTSDSDGDSIKNITNWYKDGSSISVLNLPFEGGSNISYSKDYSSYDNNVVSSEGDPTWSSSGGHDGLGHYTFDGNDVLEITDSSELYLSEGFTISVWAKDADGTISNTGMLSKYSGPNNEWAFYFSANHLYLLLRDDGGSAYIGRQDSDGSHCPSDTNWHHYVGVWDGGTTNAAIKLYVDGVRADDSNGGSGTFDNLINGADPIWIGARGIGGNPAEVPWIGSIDDVQIYDVALSEEQIVALSNSRTDIIVSQETSVDDEWYACLTPNDGAEDGAQSCSNNITIYPENYAPTVDSISLNATSADNTSNDNLTLHYTTSDEDGDSIKNITNWFKDGSSITVLNLPFEGGSNISYSKDYSSYGNDATISGATWSATGGHKETGAYSFDGNDYIDITHTSIKIPNNFTWTFWMKGDGNNVNSHIISSGGTGGTYVGYDSDKIRFLVRNGGSLNDFMTTNTYDDNVWHYVACVFEQNQDVIIYIDGSVPTGLRTYTAVVSSTTYASDIHLGKWSGGTSNYFNGVLDEVMVWNTTLSAEQVKALYNDKTDLIVSQETDVGDEWYACLTPNDGTEDGTQSCSNNITILNVKPQVDSISLNATTTYNKTSDNLTLHYTTSDEDGDSIKNITNWFKDGSSITVLNLPFEGGSNISYSKDYSGNNNDISTYAGDPYWNSKGGHDGFGAFEFDGVGDYLQIADSDSLTQDQLTVSSWFKGTYEDYVGLVSKYATNNREYYLGIRCDDTYDLQDFIIYDESQGAYIGARKFEDIGMCDGEWHMFTGTWDGGTSYTDIKLYLDGEPISGLTSVGSGTFIGLENLNAPVRIGQSEWSGDVLTGSVDDIYIFDKALSAEQIKSLYNDRQDFISSEETSVGDKWYACLTPNDGTEDGTQSCSNNITILNVKPQVDSISLNATTTYNKTSDNLTLHYTTSDEDGDAIKNITNWFKDGSSIYELIMPFEGGSTSSYTKDYSGNGYDVSSTTGSPVWNSTAGHDGFGAYTLSSDSLTISSMSIPAGDIAYSLWIKNSDNNDPVMFRTTSWSNTFHAIAQEDGKFRIYVSNTLFAFSNSTVNDGQWHHIVAQTEGTTATIYIDGVLDSITTVGGTGQAYSGSAVLGVNFATDYYDGIIDDFMIFNKALSLEQIQVLYNNRTDLIVSQETSVGDEWYACLTPNDGIEDGTQSCSNNITILNVKPQVDSISLSSTSGNNISSDNLTLSYTTSDDDGDSIKNITNWFKDGSSITRLNMPFEGGSNITYSKDYSGNGNDVTSYGGDPVWKSTGGYDGLGAYEFDGTDYISIPDSTDWDFAGDFAIEFRVNFDTYKDYQGVLTTASDGNANGGFWLEFGTDRGFTIYDNGLNSVLEDNVQDLTGLSADTWYHVVVTRTGTGTNNIKLYVDGVLSGQNTYTSTINGGSNPLGIGKCHWANQNYDLDGFMDDLKIYDIGLTPEQITALYNDRTDLIVSQETYVGDEWYACLTPNDGIEDGTQSCSNNITISNVKPQVDSISLSSTSGNNISSDNLTLSYTTSDDDGDSIKNITNWFKDGNSITVLNMPFEGGSNSSYAKDYSGYGNDGAVTSGLWEPTSGYDGHGAYKFNGSSNYITIPSSSDWDFDTNDFTIGFRFKLFSDPDDSTQTFFDTVYNDGIRIDYQHFGVDYVKLRAYIAGVNTCNIDWTYNTNWNYYLITRRSGTVYMYLNGNMESTCSANVDIDANDILIGKNTVGGAGNGPVYGYIDDLMVYDSSLSEEQIETLYNGKTDLIVSQETDVDDEWYACLTPNDGAEDGAQSCSNNITILSASTPPTLVSPTSGDTGIIDRTPELSWYNATGGTTRTYDLQISESSDFNSLVVNTTGISEGPTNITSYNVTETLDLYTTYYWRVRTVQDDTPGDWSDIWNFSITKYMEISLPASSVDLGTLVPDEEYNTTGSNTIVVQNDGNELTNISIYATDMFTTQPNPSSFYQFAISDNESNSYTSAQETFTNMLNYSTTKYITGLNWLDTNDTARIEIKVIIPSAEPPAERQSIITVVGES